MDPIVLQIQDGNFEISVNEKPNRKIQDGTAHESEAMLENSIQASTEDLELVSQISMPTQITQGLPKM